MLLANRVAFKSSTPIFAVLFRNSLLKLSFVDVSLNVSDNLLNLGGRQTSRFSRSYLKLE